MKIFTLQTKKHSVAWALFFALLVTAGMLYYSYLPAGTASVQGQTGQAAKIQLVHDYGWPLHFYSGTRIYGQWVERGAAVSFRLMPSGVILNFLFWFILIFIILIILAGLARRLKAPLRA